MAGESIVSQIGESTSETVAAEIASITGIADAAIANAEASAEAAHETAEQLAEAALRDRVVQEVRETERRIETWRNEADQRVLTLEMAMAEFRALLSTMAEQIALLAGAAIASQPATEAGSQQPLTDQSSLSQEISETLEMPITDPTNLSAQSVAESPAQVVNRRVRRLI